MTKTPRTTRFVTLAAVTLSIAAADNAYVQHNLVADKPGVAVPEADRFDSRLVNAWGIDRPPTGPWWVNAAGTGLSFLFDGAGMPFPAASPLVVTIPPPGGGPSLPTGIVFNSSPDFELAMNAPAAFLFSSIRGTISGWNRNVNPTQAVIKVNRAGAAVYTGLTIAKMNNTNFLYAANFMTGAVDVFDRTFSPFPLGAGAFRDPQVPSNYAPFNVANIGGNIAVSFAIPDPVTHEVHAAGAGYVDIFSPTGTLMKRLEHGKWMNAPWAVVMAPSNFGKASNRFLVGQFGSGQIATFESNGEFSGLLRGRHGDPVQIDGLWGLMFGNGTVAGPTNVLFFAAGPGDEQHGLFGTLTSTKEEDEKNNNGNNNGNNDGNDDQNDDGAGDHGHGDGHGH